jgi:hypothetical protein
MKVLREFGLMLAFELDDKMLPYLKNHTFQDDSRALLCSIGFAIVHSWIIHSSVPRCLTSPDN